MERLRDKLTYANVIATLALFIALGGASYAAVKLPKNSVGSKQIKNGAVTGAKIAKSAVTATSIAPGAINQTTINPSTLGNVPSATNASHAVTADSAVHANSADSAGHAGSADNAVHANSADSAADANTLDGLSPEAFAPASQLVSGAALSSGPQATIAAVPGLFTLSTRPGHVGSIEIAVSGTDRWNVETGSTGVSFPAPQAVSFSTSEPIHIADITTARVWVAQCWVFQSNLTGCVITGG